MVEDLHCPVETCPRHEKPFGSSSGKTLHIKSKHPEYHKEQEEQRSDPVGGARVSEQDADEWFDQIVWAQGWGLGRVVCPAPASYSEPHMVVHFLGGPESTTRFPVAELKRVTDKMLASRASLDWIRGV